MSRNGQGVGCRVDGSMPEINCLANNCYLGYSNIHHIQWS